MLFYASIPAPFLGAILFFLPQFGSLSEIAFVSAKASLEKKHNLLRK